MLSELELGDLLGSKQPKSCAVNLYMMTCACMSIISCSSGKSELTKTMDEAAVPQSAGKSCPLKRSCVAAVPWLNPVSLEKH
jgi:hypothetical protein